MTEAATVEHSVLEEVPSRVLASMKRKAWAKSKDSWQASECEDVATEASKATREEGTGHIPNEKIAIWLKDCRTPLGASLDEQNNPVSSQKGMLLKNGGSFEDDLSLGAEANHLLQRNLPLDTPFSAVLAKERRLQFHQKGRSMNSTGSGKSSTTVSSVSELLDLYEEDPEEILYNLGFGKDEPDIASKIPSRFFNNCSLAHGIDIKLFLNAQMQRLEVENPNFALTSRFRQIKVLTDVANAFSSLYSQVSGTPLQRIGSSKCLIPDKDQEPAKPPPLERSSSRLMETISKLNLYGNRLTSDSNSSAKDLDDDKRQNGQDGSVKIDQKLPKLFKKNAPPLATVSEETSNSGIILDLNPIDTSSLPQEKSADNSDEVLTDSCTEKTEESSVSQNEYDISSIADSSSAKNTDVLADQESESYLTEENPHTSTPEKELHAPNKTILNLLSQPKDSFELEELQGTEDEPPHNPQTCHAIEKLGKDNLLRTASQHSDSSGFAEDTSADCLLASLAQGQESLQAMGSSADSCDSETTVTSVGEDLRTPLATDQPESTDFDLEDEFLTPNFMAESKVFFRDTQESKTERLETDTEQLNPSEECRSHEDLLSVMESNEECDLPQDYTAESEIDTGSEYEAIPYTTHHIPELVDSYSDYGYNLSGSEKNSSCSLDRVHVALQRAQMKVIGSSEEAACRTGRTMITSKDLIKKRDNFSNSGYPLRRTQSLPSALLNPVRVVSKVNIVLTSGKATVCSPPSFSYKYSPEEEECLEQIEEDPNTNFSPDHITPKSELKEVHKSEPQRIPEDPHPRPQSCTTHAPSHRSQSSCSLHSLLSDWHEKSLCDHGRAWSTHSVPNFSGAPCGNFISPFSCPVASRFPYGSLHRSCSGCTLPINYPPSTTEMQLRRVLHDIRSSLQNLSQQPIMRGNDRSASGFSMHRSSVLPLYENTFQELQIMRRSLNLFRTQMMDLELSMLRQQTMVYQHLTEDERYEADQLQGLRNSVRMELQELELQLDERLLALEEQLRNFHVSSPFQRQSAMGMYRGRSTDNIPFSSPLNVIEPVTELIREQTHLKSELGLEDLSLGHGEDRCDSVASDTSSLYSSPLHKNKKGLTSSCDSIDKSKPQTSASKNIFRASVALTPSPPTRLGDIQNPVDDMPEDNGKLTVEPEKPEQVLLTSPANESAKWTPEESRELQQVIREIKESIVGDIRREIVSGLLAAVSSPIRSLDGKTDGKI